MRMLIGMLLSLTACQVPAVSLSNVAVNGIPYTEPAAGTQNPAYFQITGASRDAAGNFRFILSGKLGFEYADMTPGMRQALDAEKAGSYFWNHIYSSYQVNGGTQGAFAIGSDNCTIPAAYVSDWSSSSSVLPLITFQTSDRNRCFPMFTLGASNSFYGWVDKTGHRGVHVSIAVNTDGSFSREIVVDPVTAGMPFDISYQLPDNNFGGDLTKPGLADAVTFSAVKVLHFDSISNAVVPMSAIGLMSGPPFKLSAAVTVTPASNDGDGSGKAYIAAQQGSLFYAYDGVHWGLWQGGELPSIATSSGGTGGSITVFQDFDSSRLTSPVTIYAGYGRSTQDVVGNKKYQKVFDIQPAAPAPTVDSFTPTTVSAGLATYFMFSGSGFMNYKGQIVASLEGCSGNAPFTVTDDANGYFTCTPSTKGTVKGTLRISATSTPFDSATVSSGGFYDFSVTIQ